MREGFRPAKLKIFTRRLLKKNLVTPSLDHPHLTVHPLILLFQLLLPSYLFCHLELTVYISRLVCTLSFHLFASPLPAPKDLFFILAVVDLCCMLTFIIRRWCVFTVFLPPVLHKLCESRHFLCPFTFILSVHRTDREAPQQ